MKKKSQSQSVREDGATARSSATIIVISVVIIAACFIVAAFALKSLWEDTATDETPSSPVAIDGTPVASDEGAERRMTPYEISVSGCASLSAIIGLAEVEDRYETTPAYVFVGQALVPASATEEAKENEDSDENDESEYAQQITTTREMIRAIKDASEGWNIPYEERSTYLSECTWIHCGKYILIIGAERYLPLAQAFEEAVADPTVLDLEDIVSRLMSFELEG